MVQRSRLLEKHENKNAMVKVLSSFQTYVFVRLLFLVLLKRIKANMQKKMLYPKATGEAIFRTGNAALEMLVTEIHTSSGFSAREWGHTINSKYPLSI